jgi:hypothetical protein
MNALKGRTYGLAAFLALAGGAAFLFGGNASASRKDEKFMEARAPGIIPGYRMELGPNGNTSCTYKMDEGTYKALHPFGIVARQFSNAVNTFDVVLISSDSHESFHDPKICFSAQGWTLGDEKEVDIDVPGRGKIPFTVVQMAGPKSTSVAAYCYRGPRGFVPSSKRLQLDMFAEVLTGNKPMDSTFYRFMPASAGAGLPELEEFIKTYMATAPGESGGYY